MSILFKVSKEDGLRWASASDGEPALFAYCLVKSIINQPKVEIISDPTSANPAKELLGALQVIVASKARNTRQPAEHFADAVLELPSLWQKFLRCTELAGENISTIHFTLPPLNHRPSWINEVDLDGMVEHVSYLLGDSFVSTHEYVDTGAAMPGGE